MMKKLILTLLFLFSICFCVRNVSFAEITTENVDKDRFLYEDGFMYATYDLAASQTSMELPIIPGLTGARTNYYRLVKRTGNDTVNGRIVGIAVSGNKACTSGAATFDVTINGTVTGIQAVIQPNTLSAVGNVGSSGAQYTYLNQDRASDTVPLGFRPTASGFHDSDHPYGKATGLNAGNRIGIKVTTSSGFAPTSNGYVTTVYVLQ